MCGIAGFWSSSAVDQGSRIMTRMNDAIRHRGPDGGDCFADDDKHFYLGHRRLSIVELSDAGRQPMHSACGRYNMVFNGEIYNHLALREQLTAEQASISWRGGSDSETLLAAVSHWGMEKALTLINGMFVIVIRDKASNTLHMARDRLGEKPLYYGFTRTSVVFGSELKALRAHPEWEGELDRESLDAYLRWSSVPSPRTIYRNVFMLPAGQWVTLHSPHDTESTPVPFWDVLSLYRNNDHSALESASDDDLLTTLEARLKASVKSRLMADVPLGAFLSGGIDSSLVVALMQDITSQPVKTFTIGFHEAGYDEAVHARAVAKHLGTEHTELYVTDEDARNVIPDLSQMWDEPFADSSQIPTFLVSKLAQSSVKVALTGDGGDELFCGYSRYKKAASIWSRIKQHPTAIRQVLGATGEAGTAMLTPLLSGRRGAGAVFDAQKLSYLYGAGSADELYMRLVEKNVPGGVLVKGVKRSKYDTPVMAEFPGSFVQRMMFRDMLQYLPNTVLTKVDRASMAVGLETRAPLLDHELVEFAIGLPIDFRQRNGSGKWPLKRILGHYVPQSMIDRPKQGFGVPVDSWLRGPLKAWASDLLDPARINRDGYLHAAPIAKIWDQHLKGQFSWQYQLWNVLMFQSWLDRHG